MNGRQGQLGVSTEGPVCWRQSRGARWRPARIFTHPRILLPSAPRSLARPPARPPQEFEFSAEQGNKQIALKLAKFSAVHSVTVFVHSNQGGGDRTRVSKIALFGAPVETTKMSELKKVEES